MAKGEIKHHEFTATILSILEKHFQNDALDVFAASPLLGYLNSKTRAANRGSKSRGSFANHYALYVVIKDYLSKGYLQADADKPYSGYEGARFTDLMKAQRLLPFGSKLQNHGLNGRLNDEFHKYYPSLGKPVIVRVPETQRYWIQEDLIHVSIRRPDGLEVTHNIANSVVDIIDEYARAKKKAFEEFLEACRRIAILGDADSEKAVQFVRDQLQPTVDARVFEIVSYAVLKAKYGSESVWIGETRDSVAQEFLILYKTGRTNANDGGIDFVMRPKGRFFQVTETVDMTKYFLDIDKVQRFPTTFVVKSKLSSEEILVAIRREAVEKYKVDAVVDKYMNAIEEVINIDSLLESFYVVVESGNLRMVMDEVISQSKVEFNYSSEDEIEVAIETLSR